ncbi:MAG: hypothetical protein PHN78_05120 [Dehalococcoidales bacterium]|nr:hypothetical protein [Dehalococcoidales bacterium]
MNYDRRLMVKQRLGEIPANDTPPRLEVFTSAVPGWYIFAPMAAPGISGTNHFPVKGSSLKRGWQKLLE